MARQMFEYTKTVLTKVSFNSELFYKEVEKALSGLLPYEIEELSICIHQFIENKPELYPCRILLGN